MALTYEKQQVSTSTTLESATPTSGSRGYLYPLQGKLVVRTLARAVRPPASGQFEKLVVRQPGAVRPPWVERAPKLFSLLTSTPTCVEVATVGLEVC
jgi:hypothetical protein